MYSNRLFFALIDFDEGADVFNSVCTIFSMILNLAILNIMYHIQH